MCSFHGDIQIYNQQCKAADINNSPKQRSVFRQLYNERRSVNTFVKRKLRNYVCSQWLEDMKQFRFITF